MCSRPAALCLSVLCGCVTACVCLLAQGVQYGLLQELSIKRCTQVSSLAPLRACTRLHSLWLDGCYTLAQQEQEEGEAGVLLALPSLQLLSLLGCRCAPGGSSGSSGPAAGAGACWQQERGSPSG